MNPKLFYEIPGSGHLIPSKTISAALYLKEGILAHKKGEQLLLEPVLLFAGINEAIELFGMTVEVQHEL